MKKKHLNYIYTIAALTLVIFLCVFLTDTSSKSLNKYSLNEIIARAIAEGHLHTLGMTDGRVNWEDTWRDLHLFYKIDSYDTDMGSVEKLDAFENDCGDIGDVSSEYAKKAEWQGLTMKYKTSYWDDIPTWAKDNDGDWIICYTGTLAFLINDDIIDNPPSSWQDILEGDYKVAISNVEKGAVGQYSVYSAAIGMGGDSDYIEPGIQFFRTLAEQGRLVDNVVTFDDFIDSGAGVLLEWDFVALNYRDKALELPNPVHMSACLPSDGSVTTGYATIINKNADNPFAAALAREYILSDAGQLNLVRGYATPVRSIKIPEDVAAKRIPEEQYTSEMTENALKFNEGTIEKIVTYWDSDIMPYLQGGRGE